MSTVFRALKQLQAWTDPIYQALRSHKIQGYEPRLRGGDRAVIQYWNPIDEAYVIGINDKTGGETTYDKKTGIIRSYTRTLHDDNVGRLTRLKETHITDEFLDDLLRFTTSPIYDAPSIPNHKVHLNTEQRHSTLEKRLRKRNKT
jgi:hypothetical protein